jgi:hypothetical protein
LSEPELNFHLKISYELVASGSLAAAAEVSFFLEDPSKPVPLIYQVGYSSRSARTEIIGFPPELTPYAEYLLAWIRAGVSDFQILAAKSLSGLYREAESFISDFWLRLELYVPCYYEPRWARMIVKDLLLILACSEIERPAAENNNDCLTWDFDLVNNRLITFENSDLLLPQLEIYPKLYQSLREFYLDDGPALAEEIYRSLR